VTARWLYEPGGWIFGGLLVAALMVLQDLISLGSSDRATVSAGLAIALALPFHVSRLIIVRYFRDLSQAVAELTGGQAFSPAKSRAAATLFFLLAGSGGLLLIVRARP
jgi:hypothetical protein